MPMVFMRVNFVIELGGVFVYVKKLQITMAILLFLENFVIAIMGDD